MAEFGLLESQIETLNNQIESGEDVDSDVLSVVLDQMSDFKRRLGIVYSVDGFKVDWEGVKIRLNNLSFQTKKGFVILW